MPSKTLSILLVEDSPFDGRLLIEALRPATNAGEVVLQAVKRLSLAVEEIKRFDFSCVLLDLGLPDGSGVNNIRVLREVDRKAAIVVLTGLNDEKMASEALKQGAQDYVIKGEIDGDQLLKLVRRAVQRNKQTYALEARRDQAFFEASHDALTLLPNAALFCDRARQCQAESQVRHESFGLAVMVLDGIEDARSRYGAIVADELLQRSAQLMGDILRPSDTLARLSAQEFALLRWPLASMAELRDAAMQCMKRIDGLRMIGNCMVQPTLRVGCVETTDLQPTVDELLVQARALSTQPAPTAGAAASIATTVEVQSAGMNDFAALLTRWQPWVDAGSLRCAGLELLPEWSDATRPLLAAGATPQESAALTLHCAQVLIRQWQDWNETQFRPNLFALNVPASVFAAAGFGSQLIALVRNSGMPPPMLQLEIEEAAFRSMQELSALSELRSAGFRLVMDGDITPELSLQELSATVLDGYKLSSHMIQKLAEESLQGPARRFLSAMLGVAQSLSANLIANGVDTRQAAATLRLIGFRWLQGRALVSPLETDVVPVMWDRPVALRD